MKEQWDQKVEQHGGFEQELTQLIKACDANHLINLFVQIDETLMGERILESMYKRPSVSKQNLERDLTEFFEGVRHGSAAYVFALTGGNDRMSIRAEGENITIEMTQNTAPEIRDKWEKIK